MAVVVAVLVSSGAVSGFAQTGQITGKVLDEKSGEPLIGASVLIEGTTIGASCDLDGNYIIRDVPAGVHTLVVSSVGYQKRVVTGIAVASGRPTTMDLSLGATEIEMEAIEVTAERVRASESSLLIKRRAAPQVLDGVSAEMIKKSGDSDAGDAVKRIVGVTVVDDKRLVVRGMGGRYANVRLNGSTLPSAEPEKKEVALDLFPSALLDEVATSKTFTPDQPANFSGGSVNLVTKEFPSAFSYSFSTSAVYNSVSTGKDRNNYAGGDQDWLGIDDGTRDRPAELSDPNWTSDTIVNLAAGRAFDNQWTPIKSRTPVNSSYGLNIGNSWMLGRASMFGLSGSLTYSNSYKVRNNEIYREWNNDSIPWADYSDIDRGVQSVLWGGLVNATLNASENHKFAFKGMYNRSADDEAYTAYGFDSYAGNAFLETHLEFTTRSVKTQQVSGEHVFPSLNRSKIEWRATSSSATREVPDTRSVLYSLVDVGDDQMTQKLVVSDQSLSHLYEDLHDRNAGIGIDYTLPLDQGSTRLKFGGVFENTTREFNANLYRYVKRSGHQNDTGYAEDMLAPENIGSTSRTNRNKFFLDDGTDPNDRYDANDHMTAGYVMLDMPVTERLRVVTGVRHEDADLLLYSGPNNRDTISLHTADWLPMGSVVYSLTDRMNLRGVVSRTMARPEYRELAPYAYQDYGYGPATRGSADLQPTYIVNYDLRWEYFPRPGEILAVSVFAKEFTDPIEILVIPGASRPVLEYNNIESARNYGFELEGRKTLEFISHRLERFTLGGNLTVTESEIRILDEAGLGTVDYRRPLSGQSPFAINTFLGYTSPGGQTEATLLYNAFGDRLVRLTTINQEPYYEQTRHQVDFTISHKLWQTVGLKLGIKNLLDEDFLVTQKQAQFGIEGITEQYEIGRSVSFGISYGI